MHRKRRRLVSDWLYPRTVDFHRWLTISTRFNCKVLKWSFRECHFQVLVVQDATEIRVSFSSIFYWQRNNDTRWTWNDWCQWMGNICTFSILFLFNENNLIVFDTEMCFNQIFDWSRNFEYYFCLMRMIWLLFWLISTWYLSYSDHPFCWFGNNDTEKYWRE